MKTSDLLICIALPLLFPGCMNDKPVTGSTPPVEQIPVGISLVSRSGNIDPHLQMTESTGLPASQTDISGTWKTIPDSAGTSIVFVSSTPTVTGSESDAALYSGSTTDELRIVIARDGLMTDEPMPDGGSKPQVSSGLLTAGEWNDHLYWDDFRKFIRQYPDYLSYWRLNLQQRVILKVVDAGERPIPGVRLIITSGGTGIFEGKTLRDGSVAFFPLMYPENDQEPYHVRIEDQEFGYSAEFMPVDDDDQTWVMKIEQSVIPGVSTLDLVFTVDVTGSMGDELAYIQAELLDICTKIYAAGIDGLRVGFVFYRDRGDEFVTRAFPFTDDVEDARRSISFMKATGGGDEPESVNLALKQTLQNLDWRTDRDCIRLCFLVADAPPHYYQDEQYVYTDALDDANRLGVKLIPVAGSGIGKTTEYLFRHMAVKTMGKYIFLTNDSGIGGAHIDPDIGAHDVLTLNQIIVNTILDEVLVRCGN